MTRRASRETTITRDCEDIAIEVEYEADAYVPATRLDPGEGGVLGILQASSGGAPITLTGGEERDLLDWLNEQEAEDAAGDYDDFNDDY